MFCKSKRAASLITFVFLIASPFSLPAHADKYAIFNLGSDNIRNLVGIDDAGEVVVIERCPIGPEFTCYNVYVDGLVSYQTTAPPQLPYDDGVPCQPPVPAPLSGQTLIGRCNNGHYVYFADFRPDGRMGIFTGPDPVADFLSAGSPLMLMNANGDIAWIDAQNEMIWEGVDLTSRETPEQSTFALLGTGILGLAGAARRNARS